MTSSGYDPLEVWLTRPVLTETVAQATREARERVADEIAEQARQRFVGDRLDDRELFIPGPWPALHVRKVVGYLQIGIDTHPYSDDQRAQTAAWKYERQAVIDANLATHAELLRLHPGDTIPRAFLLAHQPHEQVDFGERVTVCRGCPEVYDSYDSEEPAEWPCGPWRLVEARTPR